ncbi:MAG TPA: hypothetical protein VFY06_09535 [Verrucomicrobiae bacterium]|nr:hypothetical protein [Verrucomicrobiae bacterium]
MVQLSDPPCVLDAEFLRDIAGVKTKVGEVCYKAIDFPLTPALSLGERENLIQFLDKPHGWIWRKVV